jgi:hypothetical protein
VIERAFVHRRWLAGGALVALCLGGVAAAGAQAAPPPGMERFRVEEDRGAPTRGALAGWLYNDGRDTVGLVRLRLDVMDESGAVIAVQRGWAYGNLRPGDRAYFRIPLPDRPGTRRILVESFVIQSVEAP